MSNITISINEYINLLIDSHELAALNNGGVDNWIGYGDSLSDYAQDHGYDNWWEFVDSIS